MNENIKTLIFGGVALVLVGLAYATLPSAGENVPIKRTGQDLFEKFTDSTKAASLEITRFDPDKDKINALKVEKNAGQWTLPSHGNYPADAKEQLKDAAGSLLGVKAVGLASQVAAEHQLFGVLDPTKEVDDPKKKKDVGMLVVVRDGKGDDLARVIIGKALKDPPGQRFVRIAEGQTFTDDVYVAKIDVEKLPTDFDKWIERDLLNLNPLDVQRMTLMDYSVVEVNSSSYQVDQRMEAAVSWDTLTAVWNLDKFQLFTQNKPHDASLGEGEELNKQKLDDMKTALDDLKIEDVRRKPAGIGDTINPDDKIFSDPKLQDSLKKMGFIPYRNRLYCTNGEVLLDLKDGVRYSLRFGKVAGVQAGSDGQKLNRFLLVSAQLADDLLQPPMLEPEPAGPAAPATTPPPAETPKANGGACQEEPKAEEKAKAEPAKTAPAKSEPAKTKAEPKPTKGEETKAGAEPPPKPIAKPDPAQLELERVRKANQRKLDEFNLKKKKAEARVGELNARFGDWYYIISEDTYKKIHLNRNDIIREGSTAKETGFGVDAFRLLEKQGIKPPPPKPPAGGPPGGPGGAFPGGLPPGFPM